MKLSKKQKEWLHYPMGMFFMFIGAYAFMEFYPHLLSFFDLSMFFLYMIVIYIIIDKAIHRWFLKERK